MSYGDGGGRGSPAPHIVKTAKRMIAQDVFPLVEREGWNLLALFLTIEAKAGTVA